MIVERLLGKFLTFRMSLRAFWFRNHPFVFLVEQHDNDGEVSVGENFDRAVRLSEANAVAVDERFGRVTIALGDCIQPPSVRACVR